VQRFLSFLGVLTLESFASSALGLAVVRLLRWLL